MRKAVAGIAVLLAALGLAGCSTDAGAGIQAFDREQADTDLLADDVLDTFSHNPPTIDGASTRFLATERGVTFFVATAGNGEHLCLIVLPSADPGAASSGCTQGGGSLGTRSSELGVDVELIAHVSGERPGWRKLAPNLYAED